MNKVFFLISLVFALFFASFKYTYAATFEDNFNTGSLDNWEVINDANPCNGQWHTQNGMVGFIITNQSCTTNLTPKDSVWNGIGSNYVFDVDMKFVTGVDHNLTYRFIPNPPDNQGYELHFQSPGDFTLSFPSGTYLTNIPGSYPNGKLYHVEVIVDNKDIKVSINGKIVREVILDNPLPIGKIALRVGTGSNTDAETWFDNVKITSIDPLPFLDVPYFSQNALPWGGQEYDHSQVLGFSNPTMNRWGCAVTSAAMVLNYHHINQLADGTPIDPGSLNTWLNQRKDGYITGYGSDGAYSYLNWSAISILTRDLFIAGKSPVKLEYQNLPVASDKSNFSTVNAKLDEDLQSNNQPDILWVTNASTSGHFIVAKGKQDSTYYINDPEWHVPTLNSFNNTYMQLGRYVPSHTDLSYMLFITNPGVDIQVTDANGNKTGTHWQNNVKTVSSDILNANYIFQAPISNPNASGKQELLGTGENIFMLPKPSSGRYTITLSSSRLTPFTANLLNYTISGDDSVEKLYGFTDKNHDVVYHITYSENTPTQFDVSSITYGSVINDIKNADSAHLILHGSAIALIQLLQNSQNFYSNGKVKQASTLLDLSNTTVNVSKKVTSPVIYQMLSSDISSLKQNLGL